MVDYSKSKWLELSSKITFKNQAFIDGKFVNSISEETFDCINPSNGKTLTKVASCNEIDVDNAVKSGRKAFDKGYWSSMSPSDRKKILNSSDNFSEVIKSIRYFYLKSNF